MAGKTKEKTAEKTVNKTADETKITAEEIKKAIEANYSPTEVVEWNGLQIVIRDSISLLEMTSFADYVVKCCFAEPDGEFQPELKDAAIRAGAIDLYTNIELPSDAFEKYDLLYVSDLWETVIHHINRDQLCNAVSAIEERIDSMVRTNVVQFEKQVSDFYDAIGKLQEQLSTLFDGVTADDVKNLIGAIANGGVDEEKLVQTYLAQTKGSNTEKDSK